MYRQAAPVTPADKAGLTDLPVLDARPEERDLLVGHGLDVIRVNGDTIQWKRWPTPAEESFAAELLGRPVQHAI